jgi:sugar/nucleoside kinase (ribokinase family)
MSGRVLVVGDVMTDVIVMPEGPLSRGSDRRARIRSLPGGSGANQAVWLGALGADVRLVARVGAADKAALDVHFRGWGVAPLLSGDPEQSGTLVTIVDPDGERSFLTDRGANLALCAADMPVALLDDTQFLVLSGYSFFAAGPRLAVMELMAEALARKIEIIVDPASEAFLREAGTANFLNWTAGASLLFANYDEAFALAGVPDVEQQTRMLGAHYGRVVIKRGALGASLGDANGIRLSAGAPQVEVEDTTGAGDAFVAGFLAAQMRGGDEAACLAAGIAAGSEAVQHIGGQPGRQHADRGASTPAG